MSEYSNDLFSEQPDSEQTTSPVITRALSDAYYGTRFVVFGEEHDVRISLLGRSKAVSDLLDRHGIKSAALLTAFNPSSVSCSDEDNAKRQGELIQEVSSGWQHLEGEGRSRHNDWPAEPSILILDINLDEARSLAQKYGQLAFVFVEQHGAARLIATDPDQQRRLIHPVHRVRSDKWLADFLRRVQRSKWCNKIGCTTCGSRPFRKTLFQKVCYAADIDPEKYADARFESLGNLDPHDIKKARQVVVDAVRRVPSGSLDDLDQENVLMSLGLIFFEIGYDPRDRAGIQEFRQILGLTWADEFFRRMDVSQATL